MQISASLNRHRFALGLGGLRKGKSAAATVSNRMESLSSRTSNSGASPF